MDTYHKLYVSIMKQPIGMSNNDLTWQQKMFEIILNIVTRHNIPMKVPKSVNVNFFFILV